MRRNNRRGLLAGLSALVTATALAFGGASAAYAQTFADVPESSDVEITKLAQPDAPGSAASGTRYTDYQADALIDGVTFEAFLVPGTEADGAQDIGTNAGQQAAAEITVGQAQGLVADTADRTGTTGAGNNPAGQIIWENLPRGLYLIEEDATSLPEGISASEPFLLSVPLTDPTDRNAWLDTIYVYPKNSRVDGTKTVANADALVAGSIIDWTIQTDIPLIPNAAGDGFQAPDAYRVDDTLQNSQLELASSVEESISVQIGDLPVDSSYYTVTPVDVGEPVTATRYEIAFNEGTGLNELAAAANDSDRPNQVEITLTTRILASEVIQNSADLYPDANAISQSNPFDIPVVEARYGDLNVVKTTTSEDADVNLAGAQFRVYSDGAEALAKSDDYLTITLPSDPEYTEGQDLWTTDEDGQLQISGLRHSDYADGQTIGPDDERYQTYWLVEVTALEGHQLLPEPIEFTIGDMESDLVLEEVDNQANTGGFELPLTGGMGTALLTIIGIAILVAVLVIARNRRNAELSSQ
jgi:LPXTG-motif cell wall-anchored protein